MSAASPRRTLPRPVVTLLLIVALAVGLELAWGAGRRARQPTGDATWIWKGNVSRWTGPEAFYAFHDFELATAPQTARVVVLGDPEYVLFLNGARIGGNGYTAGAPFDEYRVESLLAPGTNRLVAHLRSAGGEGAFLLALYLDEGPPRVVTGSHWRILRTFTPRLFRPWQEIERGMAPIVVARPPLGRWGSTRRTAPRPRHDEIALIPGGLRPRRVIEGDGGWRPLAAAGRRGWPPLGEFLVLDWGQAASGYLTLRFAAPAAPVGAAYFGLHMPDPQRQAPDAYVVGTPGQSYWEDVVPRRFRFVLLVAVPAVVDARLVPTDATQLEPIPGGQPQPGVLGRPAPRLGSAIEDEIWRKLERFPR